MLCNKSEIVPKRKRHAHRRRLHLVLGLKRTVSGSNICTSCGLLLLGLACPERRRNEFEKLLVLKLLLAFDLVHIEGRRPGKFDSTSWGECNGSIVSASLQKQKTLRVEECNELSRLFLKDFIREQESVLLRFNDSNSCSLLIWKGAKGERESTERLIDF